MNVKHLSPEELLVLHAEVSQQLRELGITRSANNPIGDLAEYLFCKAYGWKQAAPSHPSADAMHGDKLYQIKGRRRSRKNKSRQLGAFRKLYEGGFDYLAAVLFAEDYSVERALIIPHALVLDNSDYVEHTNSWRFLLVDAAWTWPGVEDATDRLRSVQL